MMSMEEIVLLVTAFLVAWNAYQTQYKIAPHLEKIAPVIEKIAPVIEKIAPVIEKIKERKNDKF